jgi:hypothetical protein
MPKWTRRQRWINHAAQCQWSLASAVNEAFEPRAPERRVSLSEARSGLVAELLEEMRKRFPNFQPSPQFTEACTNYQNAKIDSERFQREIVREERRLKG